MTRATEGQRGGGREVVREGNRGREVRRHDVGGGREQEKERP